MERVTVVLMDTVDQHAVKVIIIRIIFIFIFLFKKEEENVRHIINLVLLIECSIFGYYGDNCSTPCPENCLGGLCDTVNGSCYGCLDGYSGPTCHEGY